MGVRHETMTLRRWRWADASVKGGERVMRLLLAEDEQSLFRALVTILEHSGYEVDAVLDGLSALEYLCAVEYDAAILEIMMPGLDGIEVLRRARSRGVATPIIMLTAKSEVSDKVEGLEAGANDYLTKPFAAKELLARIRVLTRPAAALDAVTLAVGNIRLDRSSCVLEGPAGKEHLSNREQQLLELFMSSPGERIPTERLLMRVWGEEAPEEPSVVWVYISYLRKKLSAVGASAHIKASRNQGYSLEVAAPTMSDEQAGGASA